MGERVEVTRRLRQAYRGAAKAEKTAILDEFCNLTGLARSTARRCLTGATWCRDKVDGVVRGS